jgi:hypothetical protein
MDGAADLGGLVAAIVAMVDRTARKAEEASTVEPCSHAENQPEGSNFRSSPVNRSPTPPTK